MQQCSSPANFVAAHLAVQRNVVPRAHALEHAVVVVMEIDAVLERALLACARDRQVLQVEAALEARHQLFEALVVRLPLLREEAGARVREREPREEIVKPVDAHSESGPRRTSAASTHTRQKGGVALTRCRPCGSHRCDGTHLAPRRRSAARRGGGAAPAAR